MSKRFASIIVIICTLIYTTITLSYNIAAIEFNNSIKIIETLKKINISSIFKLHKIPKVIYEDVKQKSTEETNKNAIVSDKSSYKNEQKLCIALLPKTLKEMKLTRIHQSDKELIDSILSKADFTAESKDGTNASARNTKIIEQKVVSNQNKADKQKKEVEEISTFNEIINKKSELTPFDKERLLAVSKKLSPIDQAKINDYLKDSNLIKNAINLFRDRLSEAEFDDIKDISGKYIN